MQGALVFRWRGPKPGMEEDVAKLSDDSDGYWQRQTAAGAITGVGPGKLDGSLRIAEGDPQKLLALTTTPEFQQFMVRCSTILADWRWDVYVSGETLDDAFPGWRQKFGG